MSTQDHIKQLVESIRLLTEFNDRTNKTLEAICDQNAAFSHAISILSASIKSQGIKIPEELIEAGIKNLRDAQGLSPRRDKLLRDLLFGDPNSAPVIPEFTVIKGGKDDPEPGPV